MSLVNITNFNEALVLLGLYEQEVMKTGILDYPVQWPAPPTQPPAKAKPEPIEEKVEKPKPVESPQPVSPTPAPVSPPSTNITNTDNGSIIINEAPPIPSPPLEEVPAMSELLYENQWEALLTEQEKERRLFYLFVQELERTGDLRKLPAVLHTPPRRGSRTTYKR